MRVASVLLINLLLKLSCAQNSDVNGRSDVIINKVFSFFK